MILSKALMMIFETHSVNCETPWKGFSSRLGQMRLGLNQKSQLFDLSNMDKINIDNVLKAIRVCVDMSMLPFFRFLY